MVFAVAEIAYTRTFPSLHGQKYGPDLFPMLIGVGLFICGVVLIFRGIGVRRSSQTVASADGASWIDLGNVSAAPKARANVLLALGIILLYILFSEYTGFILFSFCAIALLLYRLGSSVLLSCVVAAATTLVIQLLFAKVLLVPLPAGLLQGIL